MDEDSEIVEYAPWLLIPITLLGAALRVYLLEGKGIWLDEAFSIWLANHSPGDMLQWIVRIDQHPPLYYLLLHSWINRYGDMPYNVRLLSVVFSTLTIPIIYLIGNRVSGAVTALAAALLFALSPFNIRFAQEARMYTLLTFVVAVAMYALSRLLSDARSARPIGSQLREFPNAWRTVEPVDKKTSDEFSYRHLAASQTGWRGWLFRLRHFPFHSISTDLSWIALIIFSATALYSHNTAVLFLLAMNVYVLGLYFYHKHRETASPTALRAPSIRNWIVAQVAIVILWSPWFLPFIQQASRVYQEFWIPKPTWDVILQTLRSFLNETSPAFASKVWYMWILYAAILVLGLVHFRKNISRFLFLAAMFAIPILGELIVSLRRPIFLDRTLLWTTVPLLLILAAGIAHLRFRFLIFLLLGVFATNNLSSTGDYYRYVQKEDWSNPAGYVANFAEAGDLVLFNAGWVQIPFDYYFKDYEDLYSIRVEKRGVPSDLFTSGILEPKMTEQDVAGLISLLEGRQRVWLVYSHNDYTDPKGLIPKTIASKMKLIRQRDYYGVQLRLYEAP